MANSVDSAQTALEKSDQGLHYLRRHCCPNIQVRYTVFKYVAEKLLQSYILLLWNAIKMQLTLLLAMINRYRNTETF